MRIGRWSELSVDSVCHKREVMRDADANETSGGSKRHSLQAVELSQWTQAAVQIVSNLPAPIYRFLCMPAMRTCWMAGAAAHKSG